MLLRYPIMMKTAVRRAPTEHVWEGGVRVRDGSRLMRCRLDIKFEMEAAKGYMETEPPLPSSIKDTRSASATKICRAPKVVLKKVDTDTMKKRQSEREPGKRIATKFILC
jgi:hypothetical protein